MTDNLQMQVASKQIRIAFSVNIAAGIIFHIFDGTIKLLVTEYHSVVKSLEQRLDLCQTLRPAAGSGARAKETGQFAAKHTLQSFGNLQDKMDMIWHYNIPQYLHFRMIDGNRPDFLLDLIPE